MIIHTHTYTDTHTHTQIHTHTHTHVHTHTDTDYTYSTIIQYVIQSECMQPPSRLIVKHCVILYPSLSLGDQSAGQDSTMGSGETDYIVEILEVAVLMAMADLENHHRTAAAVVVVVVAHGC